MIINDIYPETCHNTNVVFYDDLQGSFYYQHGTGTYRINQNEAAIEHPLDAKKDLLLEMLNDWEKEKYPERWL